MVFLLDSSNSILPQDYRKAKTFVQDYVRELDTSVNSVGIILIGNNAVVNLTLGTVSTENKNSIIEKIMDLPHLQQYTNTADGLCKLTNQSWRSDSSVLKLAIVLTDGRSNYRSKECGGVGTEEMARIIHDDHPNILVYSIGIGPGVHKRELLTIASSNHLTTQLENYGELDSATLNYQICFTSECFLFLLC